VQGSNDNWAPNGEIPFIDFVDEGKVVKLSPKEKSNSSMKIKDVKTSKH
jgi:hypothetical protein